MKLDRLLSIVIYLLNHELVSARSLAERFGVTVRTIQRDMDAINLAGIPIVAAQGPNGGYGIMESFKLDRRLLSADDVFYIVTALKGMASTLDDARLQGALGKIEGISPSAGAAGAESMARRRDKLVVDFSMLGGGPSWHDSFSAAQRAVEAGRLLKFEYTNNRLERSERVVEPMTIAFKWRSWYLFGFCRQKRDYRLFRISRIRKAEIQDEGFVRRGMSFDEFARGYDPAKSGDPVAVTLRFARDVAPLVEEFYDEKDVERLADGGVIVRAALPEDGWLYGYILSYAHFVEVLEPPRLRDLIRDGAKKIVELYG